MNDDIGFNVPMILKNIMIAFHQVKLEQREIISPFFK
jgi:hypothetical protein